MDYRTSYFTHDADPHTNMTRICSRSTQTFFSFWTALFFKPVGDEYLTPTGSGRTRGCVHTKVIAFFSYQARVSNFN